MTWCPSCPSGPLRFLLLFLPVLLILVALTLWTGLHHQLHLPLDLIYDGHKRLEAIPKEEEVKL